MLEAFGVMVFDRIKARAEDPGEDPRSMSATTGAGGDSVQEGGGEGGTPHTVHLRLRMFFL